MSYRIFIGFDPGNKGGIGVIDTSNIYKHRVDVHPMPIIETVNSTGSKRKVISLPDIHSLLKRYDPSSTMIGIEKVHSMPTSGVVSAFTFGMGYGAIQGIVMAMGFPYELVEPSIWKRIMLDGQGRGKGVSVATALRLWPHLSAKLRSPRGKGYDGNAEALLIAEYEQRVHNHGASSIAKRKKMRSKNIDQRQTVLFSEADDPSLWTEEKIRL